MTLGALWKAVSGETDFSILELPNSFGVLQNALLSQIQKEPKDLSPCSNDICQVPTFPRNVEDLLRERGIGARHKTVKFWWHRLGPIVRA